MYKITYSIVCQKYPKSDVYKKGIYSFIYILIYSGQCIGLISEERLIFCIFY